MNFVPTHTGVLVGDARVGSQRPKVQLRETKSYWITQYGTKYRKTDGRSVGWGRWAMAILDINSVVKC
jgi:hypothetical protein